MRKQNWRRDSTVGDCRKQLRRFGVVGVNPCALVYVCIMQYPGGLCWGDLLDWHEVWRRARVGLCLEPHSDHPRRVWGRDHDDVTRPHADSLAHVEVCCTTDKSTFLVLPFSRVIFLMQAKDRPFIMLFFSSISFFVFNFSSLIRPNLRRPTVDRRKKLCHMTGRSAS